MTQNLRVPIRPEERAFVGEMLTRVVHDISVFDFTPRFVNFRHCQLATWRRSPLPKTPLEGLLCKGVPDVHRAAE